MGSDFNFTKDMNTVSQVANMVREGLFSCETDLYAFYVQNEASKEPTMRVFTDARECYETMFDLALDGTPVSDASCLMSCIKGEVDLEELAGQLKNLLDAEQGAAFKRGATIPRVAVIPEDESTVDIARTESTVERNFSGFAWLEGDAIRVYSNAFLPHAWRNWRDKQSEGYSVSPLMRQNVVIKSAPIPTYRASFEREIRDKCAHGECFIG